MNKKFMCFSLIIWSFIRLWYSLSERGLGIMLRKYYQFFSSFSFSVIHNSIKERWYQHKSTFKNQQKADSTKLSKYVWNLKMKGVTPILSWEIIDRTRPYQNGRCVTYA